MAKMFNRITFLLISIILCFCESDCAAQSLTFCKNWEPIEYSGKVQSIIDKYINGWSFTCHFQMWDYNISLYREDIFDKFINKSLHNPNAWVQKTESDNYQFAQYLDDKVVYHFTKKESDIYRVSVYASEWKDRARYYDRFSNFACALQIYRPNPKEEIVHYEDIIYEDKKCIKVISIDKSHQRHITNNVFLDANTFQFIACVSNGCFDFKDRIVCDDEVFTSVEYQQVNMVSMPKVFTKFRRTKNGRIYKMINAEFTEISYSPPTETDLNIEVQFGIKPIPYEPPPVESKFSKRKTQEVNRVPLWSMYFFAFVSCGLAFLFLVRRIRKANSK